MNYGVSENFSVGAGTIPIFLFGAEALPLWVLPKVSVSSPQEQVHFAGGAVLGGILGSDDGSAGLLYGSATVGSAITTRPLASATATRTGPSRKRRWLILAA